MVVEIAVVLMILFGLIQTILSVLIRKDKNQLCPLDRSETIFQVKEVHGLTKELEDDMNTLISKTNSGVEIAGKALDNHGKLTIILNNLVIYQKQFLEEQKKTNELLDKIRQNGGGK